MMLETLIEQARSIAEERSFLYDDGESYLGGIEEILRALDQVSKRDTARSA